MLLKYNKNLLNKRHNQLDEKDLIILEKLLSLSSELKESY